MNRQKATRNKDFDLLIKKKRRKKLTEIHDVVSADRTVVNNNICIKRIAMKSVFKSPRFTNRKKGQKKRGRN